MVVIGAGPGGYVAAIKAAQLGMKVKQRRIICRNPRQTKSAGFDVRSLSVGCPSVVFWVSYPQFIRVIT